MNDDELAAIILTMPIAMNDWMLEAITLVLQSFNEKKLSRSEAESLLRDIIREL